MPNEYPPPIAHADFTDPHIAPVIPPPQPLFSIRSPFNRNVGNVVANPVIGIEELQVTSQRTGKSSKMSFSADPGAPIRSGSKEKRFHFAPEDEHLTVKWKLKGAAHVHTVKILVYRRGAPNAVLTVTRNYNAGQCPRSDTFAFDGTLVGLGAGRPNYAEHRATNYNQTDFPENVLSVKCSPYKLKVVIQGGGGTMNTAPARWLFLDVLLDKPKLAWGPRNVLAASPALPTNLANAVAPERDHHVYDSLVDANDAENLAGALPAEGETKRVYLQSHRFYQQVNELADNSAWSQHHALWGEGPNVPIFLELGVLRSDGRRAGNAAAAKALAGLGVVWEWIDGAEPPPGPLFHVPNPVDALAADFGAGQAAATTFLNAAANFDAATTTPPGKNCHVERGGKRGPGAPHVFPAQGGGGAFPFVVTNPAAGNWCARSAVAGRGAHAGKTGVIFQPSIQAGDGFKLRVAVEYGGYVDPTAAHAALGTAMNDMPDELVVKTGTFQVWRSIAHSMYVIGLPSAPQADLDAFKLRLSKVYMRVENQVVSSGQYFNAVEQLYAGQVAGLPAFIQLALEDQQATYSARAYGAYFCSWAAWQNKMFHHHGTQRAAYDFAKNFQSPILNYWRNDDRDDGTHPLIEPWPAQFAFQPLPQSGKIKVEVQAGHHGGVLKNKTYEFDQAGQAGAATTQPFSDFALDLGAYVEGTDANMTVTIHCAPGDQNAIRQDVTTAMNQVWARKSEERYKRSISMAWAFEVFKIAAGQLVTTRDGLRTGQFDYGRNHNIGAGPDGKALFANAQRASLDIFIFKRDGVLSTLTHEAAHALFISHPNWDPNQAANDPRHLHDGATTHCTMTTPSRGHNFCGFCMLRLRGWSIYKLDPARAPEALNPLPHPPQPDMHVRTLVETGANNSR